MSEIKIDCVALQHEGAARIAAATKGMSPAELSAYWAKRNRAFRRMRAGNAAAAIAERRAALSQRPKKSFDAVEFMHEAGRRIQAETGGMTPEEEVAYFRAAAEEFERETVPARARRKSA